MPVKLKIAILICFLFAIAGCVTLKESTLPANFEPVFDFPAYSVTPIANQDWRFWSENTDLQSLTFYNFKNNCYLFFEVIPAFSDATQDKDIISHFQEKTLNELKLSPDVQLSEQKTEKTEFTLQEKLYKIIKLAYSLNKKNYELAIYYYLNPDKTILYVISLLKEIKKGGSNEVIDKIDEDLNDFLMNIKFKNPESAEMAEFRVNYAVSEFITSTLDKYRKDKFSEVQEKYKIAYNEVNQWTSDPSNNYKAYNLLGLLYMFNDKFEKCGEGFNTEEAESYLEKSISLRKNYKEAHINRAEFFEYQNKNEEAINEYLFLVQISPTDENIYYKLGKLYEKKGDMKQAKDYYEKAVRFWGGAAATLQELEIKIKQMH